MGRLTFSFPLTHRVQPETKCLGPPLRPLHQQPQEGLTPTVSYHFPCAFDELKILTSAGFSLNTFERTFASRPGEGDERRGRREGKKPPEENNNSNNANQGTSPLRPKT